MSTQKTSIGPEGCFEPFAVDEVPWEVFSHGTRFGVRYRQLGEYGGCSRVGVCLEELEPGRQAYPAHYHMLEEEHLWVLDGSLTLRLGSKQYTMRAGDYVCFPAGQTLGHAVVNDGDTVCRYLVIGERNGRDVVVYPDSGNVKVRLTGEIYDRTRPQDYFRGENE